MILGGIMIYPDGYSTRRVIVMSKPHLNLMPVGMIILNQLLQAR
jgi:hypothetical protein